MVVTPKQIVDSLVAVAEDLIYKLREFGSVEDADEARIQLDEIYEQYQTMTQ